MIKKVPIDVLDVEEPSIIMAEETPDDGQPDAPSVRRHWSRLFLASGAAFLSLLVLAGAFLFWRLSVVEKRGHPAASHPTAGAAAGAPSNASPAGPASSAEKGQDGTAGGTGIIAAQMNDFLVPLKNDGKNQKMVVFDLTLEMDVGNQELLKEKMAPARAAVFEAVNRTPADLPRGKDGMTLMRREIKAGLETVLGKDVVKKLWFSKYIVL